MWIWIISLIVLIVCFIIVWRLFITGYNSVSSDSSERKISLFPSFSPSDVSFNLDTIRSLKSKLKSLEDKSDYYADQIDRINKKIKSFEKDRFPPFISQQEHEVNIVKEKYEDWKELFYEENEKKEKLENELDNAMQRIEILQAETEKYASADYDEIKKLYDDLLQNVEADKQRIEELQNKLEEAGNKMTESPSEAVTTKSHQEELESLNQRIGRLVAENQQLQQQLTEAQGTKEEVNSRLDYISELEKRVSELRIEMSQMRLNLSQSKIHQEYLDQQLQREIQLRRQAEEIAHSIETYKSENAALRDQLQEWDKRRSETEAKNNYIRDLENKMSAQESQLFQIKQELTDMTERRGFLELELHRETRLRNQYQEAANTLQVLKNENEGLRRQIGEMASRQSEIEGKLLRMKELEEKVTVFEDEKSRMIANLEMILKQMKIEES